MIGKPQIVHCAIVLVLAARCNPVMAEDVEKINGVAVAAYERMLKNTTHRSNRLRALETLARYSKHPARYAATYKDAARDPDELVRVGAVRGIGEICKRFPSLVGEFRETVHRAIDDPQWRVRAAAMLALRDVGNAGRGLLDDVRRRLAEDSSALVRQYAMSAVVAITQGSDDHHEALLAAINQRDFVVDTELVRKLPSVDRNSPKTIAALRGMLHYRWPELTESSHVHLQSTAVFGLGTIGPPAQAAVEDLLKLISAPIRYEKVYSSQPRTTGQPALTPKLVGRDPIDFWVRVRACWAITNIDSGSTPQVVDVVREQLQSHDRDQRLCAAIIVHRLAHLDIVRTTLPLIEALENDQDARVKAIARIAHLRLKDDETDEQIPSMFTSLRLRTGDRAPPDEEVMRAGLAAKLEQISSALESVDAEATWVALLLPNKLERALLQGDLQSQFERKKQSFKAIFRQVQIEKIDPVARTGIVAGGKHGGKLRFYWYDGDWYLSGS